MLLSVFFRREEVDFLFMAALEVDVLLVILADCCFEEEKDMEAEDDFLAVFGGEVEPVSFPYESSEGIESIKLISPWRSKSI